MDTTQIKRKATLAINGPRLNRILTLAQYDYLKRYHGSNLGVFWALFKPVWQLLVYYFVFTKIFGARQENFALMLFLGLITWMCFSEATSRSMSVLRSKSFLMKTIQINWVDFHISNVITAFVGYGIALSIYFIGSLFFEVSYSLAIFYTPLIFINIFIICLGVSLILSTLNIFFKDIEQIWSLILMFGMWTSGVFNRSEMFIEAFPPLQYINPFLSIISNIRNVLLYSTGFDWNQYWLSLTLGLIVLFIGLILFNKYSHLTVEKL